MQKLQELSRCVEVSIPGGKCAVIEFNGILSRQNRVCNFCSQVIEALIPQIPGNVLAKATAGSDDFVYRR